MKKVFIFLNFLFLFFVVSITSVFASNIQIQTGEHVDLISSSPITIGFFPTYSGDSGYCYGLANMRLYWNGSSISFPDFISSVSPSSFPPTYITPVDCYYVRGELLVEFSQNASDIGPYNFILNYKAINVGPPGVGEDNYFTSFFNFDAPAEDISANTTERDPYSSIGGFTDLDSAFSWTATVDYGDSSGIQPLTLLGSRNYFRLEHAYKDNGIYTRTVSVTNNQGITRTGSARVTVDNVPPTVGAITTATNPIQANTSTTVTANFTDPGVLDTHTAVWDWGDGTISSGVITESNGSGSVSGSHTYVAAGVYEITLTVIDKDNGQETQTYQYQTVFDQNAGWVAGGKEFTSPVGALIGNQNVTGKADFGFQVKYQAGDPVPSGKNVEFNFSAGNIEFISTSYLWLTVTGTKATFKATGKLNGIAGYTMLVSALDQGNGQQNGLIRFQIKNPSNVVVYDTQPGANDTVDPTTIVAKGKIKIH